MPTSHACIKGAPSVGPGQGPGIRRTPRSPDHDLPRNAAGVPSPLRALHPTHSELGEPQSLTFQPRTHVRPQQPQGTEWAWLHARVGVPGQQAAGILGSRDPGFLGRGRPERQDSRLLDSSRPALLGCTTTHFRVVTETFAPYKNKTPASTGACRRPLRASVRFPPRACGSASEICLLVSQVLQRGQRIWTATWSQGSGG